MTVEQFWQKVGYNEKIGWESKDYFKYKGNRRDFFMGCPIRRTYRKSWRKTKKHYKSDVLKRYAAQCFFLSGQNAKKAYDLYMERTRKSCMPAFID
jgi:hypothetical protein